MRPRGAKLVIIVIIIIGVILTALVWLRSMLIRHFTAYPSAASLIASVVPLTDSELGEIEGFFGLSLPDSTSQIDVLLEADSVNARLLLRATIGSAEVDSFFRSHASTTMPANSPIPLLVIPEFYPATWWDVLPLQKNDSISRRRDATTGMETVMVIRTGVSGASVFLAKSGVRAQLPAVVSSAMARGRLVSEGFPSNVVLFVRRSGPTSQQ